MLQVRAISRPRLGNVKLDALWQRVQLHWYLYPVGLFVLLRLATLAWAYPVYLALASLLLQFFVFFRFTHWVFVG